MYVPSSFGESDPEQLLELCARYPFATVVTPAAAEIWISHLPLLARRRGGGVVLVGHFARANGHWQALGAGAPTTAIFHGPHAYVSPTWYVTAPAVPTWNYVVVHAVGRAQAHDDAGYVANVVRDLTERFEGRGAGAWSPDGLPAEFSARQLEAIVGFEIAVERWEGKVKLSQNRSAEDRAGVIGRYEANGSDDTRALAAMMRAQLGKG
jgi:transcriptional regulator